MKLSLILCKCIHDLAFSFFIISHIGSWEDLIFLGAIIDFIARKVRVVLPVLCHCDARAPVCIPCFGVCLPDPSWYSIIYSGFLWHDSMEWCFPTPVSLSFMEEPWEKGWRTAGFSVSERDMAKVRGLRPTNQTIPTGLYFYLHSNDLGKVWRICCGV